MNARQIVLAVVILAPIANHVTAVVQCYHPRSDFYEFLGTRTAYELVRGHTNLRLLNDSRCEPLQLWSLIRHGTKYPENKYVKKLLKLTKFRDRILKNHENGGIGQLCAKDLQYLRDWKLDPNMHEQMDEDLAPQGIKDLEDFAKRLRKSYPELLEVNTEKLKPEDYVFKATNEQRTIMSMRAFLNGMFGDRDGDLIKQYSGSIALKNDTILMPHENCKAWSTDFKEKNLGKEKKNFIKGPEINGVLIDVSERLGFKKKIDYDTLKSMYDMCRYEVAWHPGKISVWCSIFRKTDLEIMEYTEDLDSYYSCGPGREMSSKIGYMTLSDMFSHFKQLEAGNVKDQPKGIFYFAHTKTIQTMLAALEIGKEEIPFTAKTYANATNRKYHASKLGPFATNVLAVFYRCKGTEPKHRVSLHVAEVPSLLDECQNGLCDWKFLKKKYGPSVDNCNLDFCDASSNNKSLTFSYFTTLVMRALSNSVDLVPDF